MWLGVVASPSLVFWGILQCLPSSTVWSQLFAISPSWRAGSPNSSGFQDGARFTRVHAHLPQTVRYKMYYANLKLESQNSTKCTLAQVSQYFARLQPQIGRKQQAQKITMPTSLFADLIIFNNWSQSFNVLVTSHFLTVVKGVKKEVKEGTDWWNGRRKPGPWNQNENWLVLRCLLPSLNISVYVPAYWLLQPKHGQPSLPRRAQMRAPARGS